MGQSWPALKIQQHSCWWLGCFQSFCFFFFFQSFCFMNSVAKISSCVYLSAFLQGQMLLLFSSVQSLSRAWLFATPWTTAHQTSLSITNSQSLLKLMSTELVMPPNHLILSCLLLLLPPITPSIKVFSNESVLCIRWWEYWSFSFSISPCNEYLGLISFRINWLDLLALQGTLKSLPQHHSSKASILQGLAFFIVQLSHS